MSTNGHTNGASNSTNPAASRGWMILGGTNHYARDRSTFTTYRPAERQVGSMHGPLRVLV